MPTRDVAPYSIYVRRRPLRFAFAIDRVSADASLFEAIFEHCHDKWGGRYHPIIPLGADVLPADIALLRHFDPDVIVSFVPLSHQALATLQRHTTPFQIEEEDWPPRFGGSTLRTPHDGLSIVPTPQMVRQVSWAMSEPRLILFDTHWQQTDALLRCFVNWNFGSYSHPVVHIERALQNVRKQHFEITDTSSLASALTELGDFQPRTYPIQLCTLPPDSVPDVRPQAFSDLFTVFVGDSVEDIAAFWNHAGLTQTWSRRYLNQLWLPTGIAACDDLHSGLTAWIRRAADPGGSTNTGVRFVSQSLSLTRLNEVIYSITRDLRLRVHVEANPACPDLSEGYRHPGPPLQQETLDHFRGGFAHERLRLQEPEVPQGIMLGQQWVAEVIAEFHPERYPNILGTTRWWQLPRFNPLAQMLIRQQPARITAGGFPAALMKRGERTFEISLVDDIRLFEALVCSGDQAFYGRDVRSRTPVRRPFDAVRVSDKGQYLAGVIHLFSDLFTAASYLKERFWRDTFMRLSRQHTTSDKEREAVRNRIGKMLARASSLQDSSLAQRLTDQTLTLARTLRHSGREMPFSWFFEQAQTEHREFLTSNPSFADVPLAEEHLKRHLQELTDLQVLLLGISARCPACGLTGWHQLENLSRNLECTGCNTRFPVSAEPTWRYRLNSLVQAAYALHGTMPVVLALERLLWDSRTSFAFAPSMEVFDRGSADPLTDLDVIAISDGRFVIGEAKQTCSLFSEDSFSGMRDVAIRVRPDIVLFSALEERPSPFVSAHIARLGAELAPMGIETIWYGPQEEAFRPSRLP